MFRNNVSEKKNIKIFQYNLKILLFLYAKRKIVSFLICEKAESISYSKKILCNNQSANGLTKIFIKFLLFIQFFFFLFLFLNNKNGSIKISTKKK